MRSERKDLQTLSNLIILVPCMALLLGLTAAEAAIIVPATVTTTQSQRTGSEIINIINGNGLSATVTEANFTTLTHTVGFNPPGDRWITSTSNPQPPNDDFADEIAFTFSSPVDIDEILIWNYTQSGVPGRGIDTFDIEVDTGAGFFSIGSADIDPANESNHVAQIISIAPQIAVTALRFLDVTNQGGDEIGLDEVRFRDNPLVSAPLPPPVPEPSTIVLCSLFGLFAARRFQHQRSKRY